MNYNPTPKDTFVADPDAVRAHHALVEMGSLQKAMSAALAQYARKQSALTPNDLGSAAMIFMRMQGAHELAETFLNLAEAPAAPTVLDSSNLVTNIRTKKN